MPLESACQAESPDSKAHAGPTTTSINIKAANHEGKATSLDTSRNITKRTPKAPHVKRNCSMSEPLCDWSSECPSVQHLLDPNRKSGVTGTNVYMAPPFEKMSRPPPDENKSDIADVDTEAFHQMQQWFPDINMYRPKTCDVVREPSVAPTHTNAFGRRIDYRLDSDIGNLRKLPGEIRNRIYRYALLEDQSVQINMTRYTSINRTLIVQRPCSWGACMHTKLSQILPIAATCRQIRWEATPIFCSENASFEFDAKTVRNACVGNYLRSLGRFADMIKSFEFLLKLPIMEHHPNLFPSWKRDAILRLQLTNSSTRTEEHPGTLELRLSADVNSKICYCALQALLSRLNAERFPVGRTVCDFADSEELSDLVWRCNKNNRPLQFLPQCGSCRGWCALS